MKICGLSVTEPLRTVCDKLGKKIPSSGKFRVFTNTTGKTKTVNITTSIKSVCEQLHLQVSGNNSCCCLLEGDQLQIEISMVDVKLIGTVRSRTLESIAFQPMAFIPSPDLVSGDQFLLLEITEISENKNQ